MRICWLLFLLSSAAAFVAPTKMTSAPRSVAALAKKEEKKETPWERVRIYDLLWHSLCTCSTPPANMAKPSSCPGRTSPPTRPPSATFVCIRIFLTRAQIIPVLAIVLIIGYARVQNGDIVL